MTTTEQQNQPARKFGIANVILILVLGALLCGEAYFGYNMQQLSIKRERIRQDYGTINNITFGLFSVDRWREKLSGVVNQQVTDFSVSPAQKKALLNQIEQQLHGLIAKALADINKPQKSLLGKIEKLAVNKFVDEDKIYAQVPSFSQTIVAKVTSPASTKLFKGIVTSKLNNLEQLTYDSTAVADSEVVSYMYNKYHVADSAQLYKEVNSQLAATQKVTYNYMYAMLGCVLVALLIWLLVRNQVHLHSTLFVMSLLFALILLAVGITSSIIEVDAQLQAFNFSVMNQNLSFNNQDLFFQSKSILQIIQVLVKQPKPDSVVIGVLLTLFVVILPIIRIIARGIHVVSGDKLANNRAVRYLAFESAKWDMSDVMVVGILMTYIGFNGILRSELSNLVIHNSMVNTTTLNSTSLRPGYFVFVGYVVFTIILAIILKHISRNMKHDV